MQPLLTTSIYPAWSNIRTIRASVREVLAAYPDSLVHAAMMTASELLENAVKYGESVAGAPRISFALGTPDGCIDIMTVNGCTDRDSVRRLLERVESVRSARDKEALYLERLQELREASAGSASLGIYRIALEGGFAIDCSYEDDIVTVKATRRIG